MVLREWITAEGRSQDDVAKAVGVSRAQMSRIVRGTSQASTEVVEALRRLSHGAVGPEDLHRVRVAYLMSVGRITPTASCPPAPLTEARAA
ncbi:helix-turn-helix domain-containing protein [Azospirillum sp. B510]|uniref:helix-turn-helix domain-containing protein n=1 Tax=Azospirillum sp. (strain B510) TaxID=137722 RepID=UPI000B34A426|nr:helix-turn-helix transcriptional regulator [Azospirillum sp. B510]